MPCEAVCSASVARRMAARSSTVIVAREPVINRVIVDPILAQGAELVDTRAVLGRDGTGIPTPGEVADAIDRLNILRAPALIAVS